MSTYTDLKSDIELLKSKTKDDQLKELQYKTEKHDYENILKSLKADNDYYKKKYNSSKKKESIVNYHGNISWIGKRYFIVCYVYSKPKHWHSINFFNSFINISCYLNNE